ncbi:MAG: hypothetical protein IID08_07300 [Candidatus Hydrogenedentes bacterium]|nr:hypothetical protein [Candidatus Hydrogenedentota bacterium]
MLKQSLLFTMVFVSLSCTDFGGDDLSSNDLLGEWYAEDFSPVVLEFFPGETVILYQRKDQQVGDYLILDESRVRVEFGGAEGLFEGPQIFTLSDSQTRLSDGTRYFFKADKGAGKRAQKALIGEWYDVDGRMKLVFFPDGTAKTDSTSAKYRFISDYQFRLELKDAPGFSIGTALPSEHKVTIVAEGSSFVFVPFTSGHAEATLRDKCGNRLRHIGLVAKMYESDYGHYPSISRSPQRLMFLWEDVYPEYLDDVTLLVCPSQFDYDFQSADAGQLYADADFWYLGDYILPDEAAGLAFLEAYTKGDSLTSFERATRRERNSNLTPLAVELPTNHGSGGNVLYADGHVEYLDYPGKYPMSKAFIEALTAVDTLAK